MRNNSILAALIASGLAVAAPANADVLAVKAGLDWFQASTDGSYANTSANFDDEGHVSGFVAFEHPVPLLPNAMVRYNDLGDSNGSNKVDLTNVDLLAYYELLDNPLLELDFGLNYRIYAGEFSNANINDSDLDEGVFMGYVRGRFDIVGTGLFAFANVFATDYDDKAIHDLQVGVGYTLDFIPLLDLDLKAGYREHSFDVQDFNSINADLTQDGWFAGVELAF
ncbi:TIGR04219 family outer membrane beta-barrel protein [uncultured Ferrimonas sp.]|uniref:TIGR04219 family outer membrane beta-barrel protein n=1 Tax=uncultured Ferrimonas sp. TaxID=432640 RepID=UPI00262DC628|nr:TIGR04219 family outer membrane beta-barrel protein [uncultured Ferrimonas sp.]